MVKRLIWVLAALLPAMTWAQEVLLPLQGGAALPMAPKAGNEAVQLPFFDDFSAAGGSLDPMLWQPGSVIPGSGSRLLPPTIGVATLDAIGADGNLHQGAATTVFPADTLLSAPIRLEAAIPADSLVLSFYYLPGGGSGNLWERTGEMPDPQDSLLLEFYRAQDSTWVTVWGRGGTSVDALVAETGRQWQYVAIAIADEAYMDSTFRFRFRNYCSLEPTTKAGMSGNCDIWHLDYVYLDRGRSSRLAPEFRDVAFVAEAGSMLKNYTAMPARQYRQGDMAAALAMTIGNLYSSDLATHYGYAVVDERGDTVYRYDGGYENAPPFLPAGTYQTAPAHAAPEVGYSFPEGCNHTSYTIVHTVREGNASDVHPQNDTVRFRQVFEDYYAYDDGSAENGYGLTSTASRIYLAYRFDLNQEDTLTAVALCFNRAYKDENEQVPFRLTVWEADEHRPGRVLYRDEERRYPMPAGIDTYRRYALEAPVVVNGSVFVGFEQENNYYINLGFDRSRNTADRIYYLTGTEWQQSILSGSLMLRPCFGAAAAVAVAEAGETQLRIFPNPVSGTLHIEGAPEGSQVEIRDALGRNVGSFRNGTTLDMRSLPAGIYMLRVMPHGGKGVVNHKIIVTH